MYITIYIAQNSILVEAYWTYTADWGACELYGNFYYRETDLTLSVHIKKNMR